MKLVVSYMHIFDLIMLRSPCKSLYNLVADSNSFPNNYVLNHNACAQYFISLRSTSCLEYLKSLNFFFKSDLLQYAVGFGHLDTVKFLRNTGCRIDVKSVQEAARIGNLEILLYCLEKNYKQEFDFYQKFVLCCGR
jgi:hypothetical protein